MDVNELIPGTTKGEDAMQQAYMGELPMPDAIIAGQECAKCGASEPMIRYHADAGPEHGCGWYGQVREHEPHLHFTCRTCLYEWTGPTLDARGGDAISQPRGDERA